MGPRILWSPYPRQARLEKNGQIIAGPSPLAILWARIFRYGMVPTILKGINQSYFRGGAPLHIIEGPIILWAPPRKKWADGPIIF
jgi:hypothetical protein